MTGTYGGSGEEEGGRKRKEEEDQVETIVMADTPVVWSDEPVRRQNSSNSSDTDIKNQNIIEDTAKRPPIESNDTDDLPGTRYSTDDESSTINGHIPTELPLEALAGKGLVTNYTDDQFDWAGGDEEDEDEIAEKKRRKKQSGVILCLSRNSSYIAWSLLILVALILIAIDVALFVVYEDTLSWVSYNLQLWFTWAAFMWCLSMFLQLIVELVPWSIKRLVGMLRPQSTEVLRMRLAYYMALRPFIKFLIISAWNWGSWAFLSNQISAPDSNNLPHYISVLYNIWECVFFLALLLFIEKFILQLIVTSFHKKAYGSRIGDNEHALKILDKLKKNTTKRKMPQEYLLKRIRRNKQDRSNKPSRSGSMDDQNNKNKTQSIMRPEESSHTPMNNTTKGSGNVHFPTLEKMDTLIAIPPIDNRYDDDDERKEDEKHFKEVMITEQNTMHGILGQQQQQQQQRPANNRARNSSHDFFNNLTRRLRDVNSNNNNSKSNNNKQQNGTTFNHRSIVASPSGSPPSGTMSPPQQQQQQQPRLDISRSSTWASTITKGINDKKPLFLNKKKQQQLLQSSHGRSHQAKALAKKIYTNITGSSGRQEITEMDFYPYFRTNQEAAAAFRMFDRDGNGSISKSELRSTCVRIYRERKNLATSMRDLSQATGKLDIILMVVFAAIWAIIVCAAFGVNVGTDLMPLWSAFIAASFIFGNSAKDAFESIIFIFVTHPFDAGDRVLIGGENWVVGRVGLLVSTFINWDGSVVYAKNSVLASQYIINVRRTGPTGESLQIHIAFSTPSHKIRKLEEHMKEWANQYPGLYSINSTSANILNFENQNRLIMSFYFEHTQNWQDPGGRWLRHNNFMMELKEECERLGITYVLPSQPFESNKEDQHPNIFDNNDDDDDENHSGGSSAGELSGIRTHRRLYKENPVEQGGGVRGPTASAVATATGRGNNNQSGAAAGAAATVAFTTGFM